MLSTANNHHVKVLPEQYCNTNSLSFQLLKSKFQQQHLKNDKKKYNDTMPKRLTNLLKKSKTPKLLSEIDHTLKRTQSIDMNHITPPPSLLWSSSNSTSTSEESDQEEPVSKEKDPTPSIFVSNNRRSVSISTSYTFLKRTMTSTSIQSIDSHYQKKSWYWFNAPQPTVPPATCKVTELPILTRSSAIKRSRVIQELLTTEKSYQTDMKLIKEIYYDTANEIFTKLEIKQIFINLLEIIAFENEFINLLESACQKNEYSFLQDDIMSIGKVFSSNMARLEQIYGDYCKKYKDSASKIQQASQRKQVQVYLENCKKKFQGRTTCWDLSSLLIKPVQRVLKYPLLLKEILGLTPEFHIDYDELMSATKEIQRVADHINEIKKRKDLVDQLIQQDKKTFTKRTRTSKKPYAKQGIQEILFDDIYKQFESKQDLALNFTRDVRVWAQKVKSNHQILSNLASSSNESLHGSKIAAISAKLSSYPLESLLEENVYNRINSYLKLFKNPMNVIEKRNHKLNDYHRSQYLMNTKGQVLDKQLQSSSEAYISLNTYLIDELPAFLTLTNSYFSIVLDEFIKIQLNYWKFCMLEWKELTSTEANDWKEIETIYMDQMKQILESS